MILKALYDYYHQSDDLAPVGMEYKEIAFLIVLDQDGHFIRLEDRRIDKKRSSRFLVIKSVNRTSVPIANAFWDNVEYVLGYTEKRDDVGRKSRLKNQTFIERCLSLSGRFPKNESFKAVCLFYQTNGIEQIKKSVLWEEIKLKPTVNISFLIQGDKQIVAEDQELETLLPEYLNKPTEKQNRSICLITGKKGVPIKTTTATPIFGGLVIGRLVAFQVNSGYDSYGKIQGLNAPIAREAEASYTTALNKLLDSRSHNRFIIGNRTFLFWASSKSEASTQAEESVFHFLGLSSHKKDPNHRIEQVKEVFHSIFSGSLSTTLDDRFYFLGLAPNRARIAIIYWNESELKDFAGQVLRHFNDMEIIDTRHDNKPYYGLIQMISAITLKGKTNDVQPNLSEAIIKSMFQGLPYPYTLFSTCMNRIKVEQTVTITRAAIIKAYLNRLNNNLIKMEVMIDKDNLNQGYLCGRLFATLEYIQKRSNGMDSIRNRYMNAASSTPATVFPTLLNLSVHHLEKLNERTQIYFEKLKTEIIDKLSADGFPSHLELQEQGRFMVGYYHQKQDFFTKKEYAEENNVEQK